MLGAPCSALAWFKPAFRFPFVIFGGLAVFWSASGFDAPKLAYFVASAVALIAAFLRLKSLTSTEAYRSLFLLLLLSAISFGLVLLSALNALASGVTASSWFRDAAPYLLLCTVPIFVVDAAVSSVRNFAVPILVLAASLSALSVAVYYTTAREHQVLLPLLPVLPSGMLTTALFCYSVSRTFTDRQRWAIWALASAFLVAILVTAVGRSYIVLAAVPFAVAALGGGGMRIRMRRLGQLIIATVAMSALALVILALLSNVAYSNLALYRLETLPRLFFQPTADASFRERSEQMGVAWTAFVAHPFVGVGPGHVFRWTNSVGAVMSSFNIDTSLSLPAKFGAIGVVMALGALAAMVAFITGRLDVQLSATSRGALIGYLAAIALVSPIASPLEDKGVSFALMCLILMGIAGGSPPYRDQYRSGQSNKNGSKVTRSETVGPPQEQTGAE